MAPNALHLLLSLATFSLLISHSATTRVMHETRGVEDALKEDQTVEIEAVLEGRMDFEINRDYPGSGANNRHTPNPPVKD